MVSTDGVDLYRYETLDPEPGTRPIGGLPAVAGGGGTARRAAAAARPEAAARGR